MEKLLKKNVCFVLLLAQLIVKKALAQNVSALNNATLINTTIEHLAVSPSTFTVSSILYEPTIDGSASSHSQMFGLSTHAVVLSNSSSSVLMSTSGTFTANIVTTPSQNIYLKTDGSLQGNTVSFLQTSSLHLVHQEAQSTISSKNVSAESSTVGPQAASSKQDTLSKIALTTHEVHLQTFATSTVPFSSVNTGTLQTLNATPQPSTSNFIFTASTVTLQSTHLAKQRSLSSMAKSGKISSSFIHESTWTLPKALTSRIRATISTSMQASSSVTAPVTTSSPFNRDQFLIFHLTSLLANRTFDVALMNHTTEKFTNLSYFVRNELRRILNASENVAVPNFSNNSNVVQLEVEILFRNTVNVNASSLTNVLSKSAAFVRSSVKELCSNISCSRQGECHEGFADVTCSCSLGFTGHRCLRSYPVDGNYTNWSNYGSCSKSCGGGVQQRTRTCTNPSPMHGGRNCSIVGARTQTRHCNEKSCDEVEWVIWIIVGAAGFVLVLVFILACCFRCKKKYYYQDYGLTKDGRSYNLTKAAYVNQAYKENIADYQSNENTVPLEVIKEDPFKNGYTNPKFATEEGAQNPSQTIYEQELKTFLSNTHNVRAKVPEDSGEYLEPERSFKPATKKQGQEGKHNTHVVYENTPERLL